MQRIFDSQKIKSAALVLRALNHKLRTRMLELIQQKGRATVSETYKELRIEQSVASQHLAILRRAQTVTTQREGKFIYYSLNIERIREIEKFSRGPTAQMM